MDEMRRRSIPGPFRAGVVAPRVRSRGCERFGALGRPGARRRSALRRTSSTDAQIRGPMLPDDEIQELALQAGEGKREALGRLAEAVRPTVCRWALVITGDMADAEDVAQVVLMKMMRAVSGFEGRSKFSSWLYRMTSNACLDLRRRKKRDLRLIEETDWAGRVEAAEERSPLDRMEAERTVRLVRTLLGALTVPQREVFDLVDLQGWKPKEAAEMLRMNRNTLRVHLLRARRRMRKEMLAAGWERSE